jgi:hypothetical protein
VVLSRKEPFKKNQFENDVNYFNESFTKLKKNYKISLNCLLRGHYIWFCKVMGDIFLSNILVIV